MKTYIKIGLIAALAAPLAASAQLVTISGPNTETNYLAAGSGIFHDTVIAMANDSLALQTSEGLSLSIQSPINFLPTATLTDVTGGDWQAGTRTGAINFYVWEPNFEYFQIGDLSIGFIGEESGDPNSLEVEAFSLDLLTTQGPTTLFDYNDGPDVPPMSYEITADNEDVLVKFSHNNANPGFGTDLLPQEDMSRFRIWRSATDLDNGRLEYGNQYLFAISDRNEGFDSDIDDGFFYLTGDITPVPEPSQIAALAMLGLGGALYLRRRIKK